MCSSVFDCTNVAIFIILFHHNSTSRYFCCRKKYVPKHERFFFMCPLNASFKVSKENSSFDGPIIVNFGTRFQHFFVELVVVVLVPCNYNIIVVLCSFCNCSLESS